MEAIKAKFKKQLKNNILKAQTRGKTPIFKKSVLFGLNDAFKRKINYELFGVVKEW